MPPLNGITSLCTTQDQSPLSDTGVPFTPTLQAKLLGKHGALGWFQKLKINLPLQIQLPFLVHKPCPATRSSLC